MKTVALLNTAVESDNDGDHIIVNSIFHEVPFLREAASIPTHRLLNPQEIEIARRADLLVVTGTNIISSRPRRSVQWPLSREVVSAIQGKVVFLGVGWWQYQKPPSVWSRSLIRRLMYPGIPASARDDFTVGMLRRAGVSAVNTNCPTMWSLSAEVSAPGTTEVVYTVTDYHADSAADQETIDYLSTEYDRVLIWPQGDGDSAYLASMALPSNVTVTARGLDVLDHALRGRDYVGTRLHAGVRAAQLGSSVTIQAVDNRALEIGRDTRLPVVARSLGTAALIGLHKRDDATPLALNEHQRAIWIADLSKIVGEVIQA